jgi:adenylate cyclase
VLSIHIRNSAQDKQIEHPSGPIEFGRGSRRRVPRFVVESMFVSRDHLELEELANGRVRVRNLSQTKDVKISDGTSLGVGASSELSLPLGLAIGDTTVSVCLVSAEPFDKSSYQSLHAMERDARGKSTPVLMQALGDAPSPETVARWLEQVIALQRAPAGSKEFHDQTARALVELVGLDLGMILLRRDGSWEIMGYHAAHDSVNSRYSRTLLSQVVADRRTFFQDLSTKKVDTESLLDLEAVVVSPIFGINDEVAGVLYGTRGGLAARRGGIRPLEAQVVQLLAAAVGANMTRTLATRTRVQFEQFFSHALVEALERDPNMLEGRHQEVTILASDLRGFTALSERLEPQVTCRVVRDVMEKLTERIVAQGGVIVDYAGDGILAMWNAPVAQEDHAARACRAALAMLDELPGLNGVWRETVGAPLAIGIGVNTGPAHVGNTGSSRRLKYGPHGLTVNLASRVQDATKKMGTPLLISSATWDRLAGGFSGRAVGQVSLPGVSEQVTLFELHGESTMRSVPPLPS